MKRFMCYVLIFITNSAFGQVGDLSYSGNLLDQYSEEPIVGATVVLQNEETSFEAVSDVNGRFVFTSLPAGAYQISFESLGYQSKRVVEIEVSTGVPKNHVFQLTPSEELLEEVVVKAESRARSSEAITSINTLTVEESFRFPGTFFDPARLANHYAGVVSENDQANNLVVRGNSPNGLGWFLQGVEIVNPNHTSNAGTLNDRPSQRGGGVNILSAQMLDNSTFLTGAFPASYGNATTGIFDMQLREGAKDRTHYTGQIGLLGIDVAAEGALNQAKSGSYLINYRYSTIGLLSALGLDLGDEAIDFQDLSFHLNWQQGRGNLSFFGMGGSSRNIFTAPLEAEEREFFKDQQDITFKGSMAAVGLQYQDAHWQHSLVYSGYTQHRFSDLFNRISTVAERFENDKTTEQRFGLHSKRKIGLNYGDLQIGLRANFIDYNIHSAQYFINQDFSNKANGFLWQFYADTRKTLSDRITMHGGLHLSAFTLSQAFALEPRLAFQYGKTAKSRWGISYGLHSRIASPREMLISDRQEADNLDLKFIRSHHFILSNTYQVNTTSKFTTELYYQSLFNLPIAPGPGRSLSTINALDYIGTEKLSSEGTGANVGLELTYQQYFSHSTYLLLNGSISDSKYMGGDGVERNTRYNSRYGLNFTGGKELNWQKNDKVKILGLNLRASFFGGFWEGPIDIEESKRLLRTVYDETKAFTEQLPDLIRVDARIYYKRIKRKYTSILGLDLLNAINRKNIAYRYYDPFQDDILVKNQLGIIPNLSYRIEF